MHIQEECAEKNCRNNKCLFRHRRLCIFFEKCGVCKFKNYCEYKHRKADHIIRIEDLENKLRKYDDEYELFLIFFKSDIIKKISDIKDKVREETKYVESLSNEVLLLKTTINKLDNQIENIERINNETIKYQCKDCLKVFKREM